MRDYATTHVFSHPRPEDLDAALVREYGAAIVRDVWRPALESGCRLFVSVTRSCGANDRECDAPVIARRATCMALPLRVRVRRGDRIEWREWGADARELSFPTQAGESLEVWVDPERHNLLDASRLDDRLVVDARPPLDESLLAIATAAFHALFSAWGP